MNVTTAQAALEAGATGLPAGNNMAAWASVSIIDNVFTNTTATNAYPITTMTYALVYQNLELRRLFSRSSRRHRQLPALDM